MVKKKGSAIRARMKGKPRSKDSAVAVDILPDRFIPFGPIRPERSVLVFGNAIVAEDSLPLRILPTLRRKFPSMGFKEYDTSENLEEEGRELIILDSALDIKQVVLIEDLDNLEMTKSVSMHDFDLPITLRILLKLKAIDSVKIIAIPVGYGPRKALKEVSLILSTLLSS